MGKNRVSKLVLLKPTIKLSEVYEIKVLNSTINKYY